MHIRVISIVFMWAALFLPSGALATPRNSIYRGRTAQHLRISLKVVGGAVQWVKTTTTDSCGVSRPLVFEGKPAPIDPKGRFAYAFSLPGGGFRLNGRFRGASASGTLRAITPRSSGRACDSGRVKFTVRR